MQVTGEKFGVSIRGWIERGFRREDVYPEDLAAAHGADPARLRGRDRRPTAGRRVAMGVEFLRRPHDLHGKIERGSYLMGPTAHPYLVFETASGFCGIAWNSIGITRFQLPARSAEATAQHLLRRLPGAEPGTPPPEVAGAVAAAKRYFEGEKIDFSDFQLDLGQQDELFKQIYAAARRVGWGQTTTYGTLAKQLGAGPEAARDVGQAMAKNPVPLIIPCHRVLAAGGKVGGFSAPGGSTAKIRMLQLEGVQVEPPSAQLSLGL